MDRMENNMGGIQKTNWAILCPGPSLTKWREFDGDDGCYICVNGAIEVLTPDYWAMVDEEVFNIAILRMDKIQMCVAMHDTTLWVPDKWNDRRRLGRIHFAFDNFKKETWTDLTLEMNTFLDHELKHLIAINGYPLSWNNTTMFQAIALAIKKGARHIRIYGADLAGKGYCVDGMENSRTVHTDERWIVESFWLEKIIAVCARRDITIERMRISDA
jgi:hypothetical protein